MSDNQTTVAVIPAAGRGTRLQPATHAIPKPLLPVVDRPAIEYVIEEAADAGAREVVVIVDPDGGDLFEQHFAAGGLARAVGLRITTVRQDEPLGLGDAIRRAAPVVGDRRFMCLLADTILRPGCDLMGPLLAAGDDASAVALNEVDGDLLDRYGVVSFDGWDAPGVARLTGAIEKPGAARAPSNLGLIGRYVFNPDVFDALAGLDAGHGGEIQLTDAVDVLARWGTCRGVVVDDGLLDMGRPIGLLGASAVIALHDKELRDDYLAIVDRERRRT